MDARTAFRFDSRRSARQRHVDRGRRRRGPRPRRSAALLAALGLMFDSIFVVGSMATPAPVAAAAPSSVTEFQPTLNATNGPGLTKWGGRSVSVTVKPGDDNTAIAATEAGGLFRTTDGGANWTHLDGLVPFRMADVEYAANNA